MQTREYNRNEVIIFCKTTDTYGGLSNMAAGYSLNINGVIIPSAEHLYQACKFPDFPNIQEAIISELSPVTAKRISRKNNHFARLDWKSIRVQVMRWILEVKLSQNWDTFSQLLRQTDNKSIVELSYKDAFWGAMWVENNLLGVNALGRLLMEVRDKYVKTNSHQACVEPLSIKAFLLYGYDIGLVCNDAFDEEYTLSKALLDHH